MFITLELYLSCVFAVVENSPKTQFWTTRWNSTLKARYSLSSNGNISAKNTSNLLENPPFESVFRQLVNRGRIISVSGLNGCGHTTELNRDLVSKSRLTSNHDLAYNRDLIYF